MATKTIRISDLSGQDIVEADEMEVRVLEFPELSEPVKLDASKTETDRLKLEARPMALLELVTKDGASERIAVDAELFRNAVRGDIYEVLSQADSLRPLVADLQPRRRGATRRAGGSSGSTTRSEKVDYSLPENSGIIHRGRITEVEAAWVRDHLEEANANRQRAGQPLIDPRDAKEKQRYGF